MSLNKVMLIGNVGADPEIRYIDGGVCTASLSLATSTPSYTLPGGTVVPERTEWHRIQLWRRLAEVTERYVHKGDKLYVEGRLRYNIIEDKRGQRATVVDVLVENMEMLSPRSSSQQQQKPTASAEPANDAKNDSGNSRSDTNENNINLPF